EPPQLGQAGHRPVRVQDFADDGRLLQPGQPGQVHAPFRVTGPDEDAALAGHEAHDVALAADEVGRGRTVVDGHADGAGGVLVRAGHTEGSVDLARTRTPPSSG